MQQRFFFGSLTVALLMCAVMVDAELADTWSPGGRLGEVLSRGSLIPLLFAGIILAGCREMNRLMRSAGLQPHARIATVMSLVLLLSPWLCATRLVGLSLTDVDGLRWQLIWLVVLLMVTVGAQLVRGVSGAAVADLGATWLMALYLGLLPSFAMQLRSDPYIPGPDAAWLVFAFLLITKASDIGAYLVGTTMGRHKLMPAVSPGKSVEGAVGGVIGSVLVALLLWRLYFVGDYLMSDQPGEVANLSRMTAAFGSLELWQVTVFGLLMSIFGQVGDLFESLLKRVARKKDSAAIVPGYGGVLDLIDSPVLAAPVAWFLLTVWWEM